MLNSKGWGIQAMMIMVVILMLSLVISAAFAQSIFKDILNPATRKLTYKEIEKKVESSLIKYKEKYYNDLLDGEKIEVKISVLQKNNMIEKLIDETDKECTGYGHIKYKDEKYSYKAYIKCDNYKTKGYTEE